MNKQLIMNFDEMKYIVGSVMEYAYESVEREKSDPCQFNEGRKLAFYEVLDTIYNRLHICDQDPKDFGYSENWEKEFFAK